MSQLPGTRTLKAQHYAYDFAVDGGAVGTLTLRTRHGSIPAGSVIIGGYVDVSVAVTSGGAGTGALQVEAANDTVNQAVVSGAPWSTTGRKSVIPVFTGATSLKASVDRDPALVIGTAALTAGAFELVLFYE